MVPNGQHPPKAKATNGAPRIAFALSTKDRTQLTQQILSGLDCGGFDLIWCDGSTTAEGKAFPGADHFQKTRLKEVCYGVTGGPDAAIQFSLRRLLELDYDYVGLIENDIALKPGWLPALLAAWRSAQAEGFQVGAATARSIVSRVLARGGNYVVQWNMGAGMVLFSRAAAQAVLADYQLTNAAHVRDYFQAATGVDLGSVWELFMEKPDRKLGADWHFALSILKAGLVSVGTIPHYAENIDVDLEEVCRTRYLRSSAEPLPAHCLGGDELKAALSAPIESSNDLLPESVELVNQISTRRLVAAGVNPNFRSTFGTAVTSTIPTMTPLLASPLAGPASAAPLKSPVNFLTIVETATSCATLERLVRVFSAMEPSAAQPPQGYRDVEGLSRAGFCSAKQVLAAVFELAAPKNYLEIGTRRGHSLCLAACSAPARFEAYSFDLWTPEYAGEPNPGPDLVGKELAKFGFQGTFNAFQGDSRKTVPEFFANPNHPQYFDVIYVDGDHTDEGALIDLENTIPHLAPGGFLLFDDITHPQHLTLLKVWKDFVVRHPELEDVVETRFEHGWALARKGAGGAKLAESGVRATPASASRAAVPDTAAASANGKIGVHTESEFATALKRIIAERRPRSLIETGTHIGTGTTTIISNALFENRLEHAEFHSIEVNPQFYLRANQHLQDAGLARFVHAHNGLSVPRHLLPTAAQIQAGVAAAKSVPGVYIDHEEARRVALYLAETDFSTVEDDLLGRCLAEFQFKPDLLLLDSAGHLGWVEFQYVLQLLRAPCVIALDDVNHLKHYLSLAQMRKDSRFTILTEGPEKFGFCIAQFTPASAPAADETALAREYFASLAGSGPVAQALTVKPETLRAYRKWKAASGDDSYRTDTQPIESMVRSYPTVALFHCDWGCVLRHTDSHLARKHLESAVRLAPDQARFWQELARFYFADLANLPLALAAAENALRFIRVTASAASVIEAVHGSHGWEGDFCWLDRQAAFLVHTRRLSAPMEMTFELLAGDLWCYGGRPFEVTVSADGSAARHFTFRGDQHRESVRLLLHPDAPEFEIQINSTAAFVPAQLTPDSKDDRRLAVRICSLALRAGSSQPLTPESLRSFLAKSIQD